MQGINRTYVELWREYSESFELNRIPLVYPELNDNGILFVGLNPSFNDSWNKERIDGSHKEFFRWEDRMEEKLPEVKQREVDAREEYQYFKHFRDWFGPWHEGDWEHIDLFAYRMRSQTKLKDKIGVSSGKCQTEFAKKQFDLAINLIDELNPEVIVVVNAYAGKLIQNHAGEDYQISNGLDQKLGCYYMESDGSRYPILFSGMITGQRALDTGSRRRLKWQINSIRED